MTLKECAMTAKKPTASSNATPQAKTKCTDASAIKTLKPTKWGADLLVKMEAFRQALATQK
jgi:hypothetical protein